MDRNTIIGFVLMFAILMGYNYLTAPTPEQIAARERVADSLQNVKRMEDSLANLQNQPTPVTPTNASTNPETVPATMSDSARVAQYTQTFGEFAASAGGEMKEFALENSDFKLTFSNKGGHIKRADIKGYKKIVEDSLNQEIKLPLELMEDPKNRFDYYFPTVSGRTIKSGDLFFEVANQSKNAITFRAKAGEGYFEQNYKIGESGYNIDYNIRFVNLNNVISGGTQAIKLQWVNHLDKLEKNVPYEQRYSSVYYKEADDDVTYCSCTGDDNETLDNTKVEWFSHSNQFFNSTLMTTNRPFTRGYFETKMRDEKDADLKKLITEVNIPLGEEQFAMKMYIGPNEFTRLQQYDNDLEYVIPYGSSIFGGINRWIIRPIFNFLSQFISSAGIVILLLTLLVKLLLYPFMFKTLKSQSLMAALKPQIEKVKAKNKDDAQAQQMATMKLYGEYGVSPLGGCLPMVAQMPVWFALYRFFPAAIEFRQKAFLWATDLSSYDAPFTLPFEIPFYGDHVSLFTLLWAGTTVLYTYYNSKHLDMSANPAMKYMQYFMPIMFLFFFNSFAAGLTCYLFFSNTFNIAQTLITKNVILDQDKLLAELEENKNKPKKKSGIGARFQEAMKQAQEQQAAQEKTKGKRKK